MKYLFILLAAFFLTSCDYESAARECANNAATNCPENIFIVLPDAYIAGQYSAKGWQLYDKYDSYYVMFRSRKSKQ